MKGFVTLVCFLLGIVAARSQPIISSQPQSLTVNAGSTARFAVSATDSNAPNSITFQWQRNGAKLSDGGDVSGSATAQLTLSPVALSDAGTYTVVVSATDGAVTNQTPAQLMVLQGTIVNFQISGFAGGPSNLVVELFDHDKPATVENFIHYITSGAYTNMFFDRLLPDFVIQGGDWSTSNRTSTTPGLSLIDGGIYTTYVTDGVVTNPPLPAQVDSEFSSGPFISNTYGTMAMALAGGNQNSAANAFFINLVDNSANLDFQSGGFTVFGRVLTASNIVIGGVSMPTAGTNLLNYFNNTNFFSKPGQGIFDGSSSTNLTQFTDLPVNYDSTNQPANNSLLYVVFTFLSNSTTGLSGPATPPVDNTPPTVAISYPTPGLLLTNGTALNVQGTASDNVGLALVNCSLVPLNGANNSQAFGTIANGTTNWSLDFVQTFGNLPPGEFNVQAVAVDGAGNSSTNLEPFVITAVLTNGYGTVSATNIQTGAVITNGVGGAFEFGVPYILTPTPAAGWAFLGWSTAITNSILTSVELSFSPGLVLTATFISNDIPGAIAFTYPPAGAQLTNNTFTITGTLTGIPSAQITLQLFSQTQGEPIGFPVTNNATGPWSVPVTNLNLLQPGTYILQAVATDPQGRTTVISETFTVTSPGLLPVITSEPQGETINAGSMAVFTVAVSDTNAVTYQWQLNGVNLSDGGDISGSSTPQLIVSPAALSDAGAYTVVVGSAFGSVSSQPAAQLTVVQGTIVNFQISGFAGGASNVVVELFDHDKPATVENFIHYVTSAAYKNMFFDRLVPGFVLQGGDWNTVDRTNSTPPVNVVDSGIYDFYVLGGGVANPPLPHQVDSEFNVGPFISNTYGTMAMALQAGNQDSAANGFFFNLADNSANLDFQNGGFTVFGRVINPAGLSIGGTNLVSGGTNVLNYFGNSNLFSAPAGGIYTNNSVIPSIPVNYHGTNMPVNTNLFYVDFTFLTNSAAGVAGPAQPPVHTNVPTVAITYPASGQVFTNGSPFVVLGTASDDVGLAFVQPFLNPLNGANGGGPFGDPAIGTTNWSLDFVKTFGNVPPGEYYVEASAQNGAGYPSTNVPKVPITVTAVVTNGIGTVAVTNVNSPQLNSPNAVGYAFQTGSPYVTRAIPGAGQVFLNWTGPAGVAVTPAFGFVMSSGLLLTANFIPNSIPGNLAITYPPNQVLLTNNNFVLSGTLNNVASAQVTCTVFSRTTGFAVGQPVTVNGTTAWSTPVTNLASLQPGQYIVQAVAYDPQGRSTVVTNGFTLMAKLNLVTNGGGTVAISPSSNPFYPYLVPGSYTAKAAARPGSVFFNWNDGANVSLNPVESFTISSNLTLTATFVSNDLPKGLSFTSPKANARLTEPTFAATGNAPASSTNVTYQLFSQSTKLSVGPAVSASPVASGGAPAWNVPVTNLVPGNYTAIAVAYDGQGRTALASENFSLLAPFHIQFSGFGTVSPNLGNYLVVGQQYTIKAIPNSGQLFDNWSGAGSAPSKNNPFTFTMTTNLSLTLTFASNYFPNIQGTYYGLYFPSNATLAVSNSGYISVKLEPTGTFSGQFTDSARSISLGGAFLADGTEELIGGFGGLILIVDLSVDLTNGTGTLTGVITNAVNNQVTWTANLLAYRGVTSLSSVTNFAGGGNPGNFVATIFGSGNTNFPPGDGYASVAIAPTGMIKLTGMLADNTAISQSVGMSKEGIWPFYSSLYGARGAILGWETNTSPTNFAGPLNWIKLAKSGIYYSNGFASGFNASIDSYLPPSPGSRYVMTVGAGTLVTVLTNALTVSASGQFVPAASADNLKITLITSTGLLSGQFFDSVTGKTVQFKGAFVSPAFGGSGYTVDGNGQTGYFEIHAAPASPQ